MVSLNTVSLNTVSLNQDSHWLKPVGVSIFGNFVVSDAVNLLKDALKLLTDCYVRSQFDYETLFPIPTNIVRRCR